MTDDIFIREYTARYLSQLDVTPSQEALIRYAVGAAHWKRLRLRYLRQRPTPGQRQQFDALTAAVRRLSAALGLKTCPVDTDDGVAGITDRDGFLPGDPSRVIYQSWAECG